jgi:hypothetical protein
MPTPRWGFAYRAEEAYSRHDRSDTSLSSKCGRTEETPYYLLEICRQISKISFSAVRAISHITQAALTITVCIEQLGDFAAHTPEILTKSTYYRKYYRKYHVSVSLTMGYPDSFEGFMIESTKNWTTFKKQEVGAPRHIQHQDLTTSSSSLSPSKTTTSTSRSSAAVFAAPMSTASLAVGARSRFPSA